MGAFKYIESDYYRRFGNKKHSISRFLVYFLHDSTFRWLVNFRLAQSKNIILKTIGVIFCKLSQTRKRIQIPLNTKVGYGLLLAHDGFVVINKTAVIGDNCTISQFVTIGSLCNNAAVIGDGVYIGPNTCIVENVHIGNDVTIGAGSVVTKNVPDGATVAGNYARIISHKKPGRFIVNRWEGK